MSNEITLTYYAKVEQENDGYIVSFRDLENIFTEGDSIDEALFNAQEALDGVLAEMAKEEEVITLPSAGRNNEFPVPVSPEIAAPILLNMLRQKKSQSMANVAKVMNIPYQQYQRLEHNCNMTLKSLKRAASAMGGRIEIKVYMEN